MASKAVAGAAMTVEQYYELGEDPPMARLELSEGRLIVAPSSNFWHNAIRDDLNSRLRTFALQHAAGTVTSETDVLLGPATVRRPDVCFFRRGRLRGLDMEKLPLPPPDIAFEILSPHDRKRDLQLKVRQYLDAGVSAVWLLDPKTGQATRHAPGEEPESRGTIEEPELLPGFSVPLAELIAAGRQDWA